jgi:tRNA threonylcarbamoyl adenosine modification protein YeaZ/ribosomal-protein-alanine acetyltransferase
MTGLAIECATERAEVAVVDDSGRALALVREDIGHGHTRRVTPMIARALAEAKHAASDLAWVAADRGPGSFTGVRVGLASAEALALATQAELLGADSLESLAAFSGARRALVVPLVGAGRRDLYAGFFRADPGGAISVIAAPRVGPVPGLIEDVREAGAVLPGAAVRFVGPGAARERAALEAAFPGSTQTAWREDGLSALDLARLALQRRVARISVPADEPGAARVGVAAGAAGARPSPARDGPATPDDRERPASLTPLYVRAAQAEEKVRRRVLAEHPPRLRTLTPADVHEVAEIERRVFADPWPESFFLSEIEHPLSHAMLAEQDGTVAGYCMAWLGEGAGHLGNLAVAPEFRRRGIAAALLEELLTRARAMGVEHLALEVRVTNFPAQWFYRARGFRLAGLRRRYYRDNHEDALIMEWRGGA